MPNEKRISITDMDYHVTSRMNNKAKILLDTDMKNLLIQIMKKATKKFDFSIKTYCIMDNHFHLIIHLNGEAGLPEIIQWIKRQFARRYNHLTGRTGHVWGERYFSKPILHFGHYLTEFAYIAANPVVAGLCEKPEDYPFSGIFEITTGHYRLISEPSPVELKCVDLMETWRNYSEKPA